ncbi:histidinol-phosphate aminotransferase [Ketogulonicigenium robustum]|uniref:Histidinol-phosphate aminotransferase n=1 Tax=Ketogulonicigenium robustum TaxID=92947 RepID=A0A1W6P137_9RHOB|nr:pyridoxal phosphate-dependent aminotransferase [Ketogulonicigenium robustum]ARO15154.1 histidinol-phosphate aminotransferase [Ketogulonicigenium robustum]
MTDPRLTPLAASLPATVPFVGPETQERAAGRAFTARIGANENVFGPSPRAIHAMEAASAEVWKYADPENFDLRHAISHHHGVPPENIAIDAGIDTLLGLLVRLTVTAGDKVVTSAGAYPTFNFHVAGFGGELVTVPYADDHEDPAALITKAVEVGPKLIYIANPDNPMGTWHSAEVIQRMIDAVPAGSLLVLDEAYIEFAPEGTAPALDVHDTRVIRLRTFSKAYGMAGARVAYAIGARDLIAAFDRVRNHFGMNRTAQIGAVAAIQDQGWIDHVRSRVGVARDKIAEIAAANGLVCLPSATNFVAIDCGQDGAFARRVLDALVAAGIFVRMPSVAPLNRCIRVSAGTPSDLDAFELELPKALAKARAG